MSITRHGEIIRIVGTAAVEEAEVLAALLAETPDPRVDWSESGPLHTAVVQVLLMLRPTMIGSPADPFSARWLVPLLSPAANGSPQL